MSSTASAPGKAILFGEHAVVYERPAVAVPIFQVQARATVAPAEPRSGILLIAEDLGRTCALADAPPDDPFRTIVADTLAYLEVNGAPDLRISITSTIPIARGMGSGTATSAAVVRALASYFGAELSDQMVSELVFEVEKIHHGTPSGIDNTVVSYGKPIYFVKGLPFEIITVGKGFHLLIADTGVPSPTRIAVSAVREGWKANPEAYGRLFDEIGEIARLARGAIASGDVGEIGRLMNENQRLLRAIDVSSPELERLIDAALAGGATGAKLSGAGRGGNMIALVDPQTAPCVEKAVVEAGARGVFTTEIN